MDITSPSFKNNGIIPEKHACEGENLSPALNFDNVPKAASTLVLIVVDPDAPCGTFDHWIVWNIPADSKGIEEGQKGLTSGLNSYLVSRYKGPCPPIGSSHRYFFKLYALDTKLKLPSRVNKKQLMAAMQEHIIDKAELIGIFQR